MRKTINNLLSVVLATFLFVLTPLLVSAQTSTTTPGTSTTTPGTSTTTPGTSTTTPSTSTTTPVTATTTPGGGLQMPTGDVGGVTTTTPQGGVAAGLGGSQTTNGTVIAVLLVLAGLGGLALLRYRPAK